MAEPTSAYSLYGLILRVAKAASIAYNGSTGQSRDMAPIDEFEFESCLDIVNDGIKFFISSAPPDGWRWMNRTMEVTLAPSISGTADAGEATTLTDSDIAGTYADDYFNGYVLRIIAGTGLDEYATVTDYDGTLGKFTFAALSGGSTPDTTSQYRICRSISVIDSDPARYQLSDDFQGEVTGPITYAARTGHGGRIDWCHEASIRGKREIQVLTGYPAHAATLPYSGRRWELIIDPSPSSADVLTFPYRAGFAAMQAKSGTATGASATTLVDSGLANLYPDDYFIGWTAEIVDGTGRNSYAVVTDYTGASGTFTVADWLALGGVAGGTDPAASSIYFVHDGNTHPAGMQFDEAVLSACLAKAEMVYPDVQAIGYMGKFMEHDLVKAWQLDARSAPRKLGRMLPGRGQISTQEHIRNDVTIV